MSFVRPSTQELVDRNIAGIENALNQKTPPADQAFNTAHAIIDALTAQSLYAFAADRAKANLAITAGEDDLEQIGIEYETPRNQDVAWEGSASLDSADGETVYLNTKFVGPQGITYYVKESVTAPSGDPGDGIVLTLVCDEAGTSGNLNDGDELTIQTPIDGDVGRIATVTSTTVTGTEIEDLEVYRVRVLDEIRSEGGGGNSSDLRSWSQEVAGVRRAYPFSGPPSGTAYPGERTVYVEATESVDSDGIPPTGLLDQVKAAILADPNTGESREILGLTEDTLYVEPIVRTGIYITLVGLSITTGSTAAAQSTTESALDTYMKLFSPFVQGLDADFDRMDEVTSSLIGREVQNVLDQYGGTVENVLFGTAPSTYVGKYSLGNGEKLKLAGVTWEDA